MFTGPTARDDAAGHAVADVKTAAVFACGIKAFDGVPSNVENLRVVVDRKAACAVVEEHHETHGVEGPFADLRLENLKVTFWSHVSPEAGVTSAAGTA